MITISGEYEGELHCSAVHGPSGCKLSTDAPKDNQGLGEAFSPTDLIATGYATCIATTMALAARKYGVDLKGLRYEVSKEMTPEAPRKILRLAARIWLPAVAQDVPEGVLERAAHSCPVHLSLAPTVEKRIDLIWP